MKKVQILCFGASIAYGCWDGEGGWVDRLKRHFLNNSIGNKKLRVLTYNLGRSGNTVPSLLKRFEDELSKRLIYRETVIVFQIGNNDSEWLNDRNTYRYPPNEFKDNLSKLIQQAKKHTAKIIFLGICPIEEGKMNPIPWANNLSYKTKLIKVFDEIIELVCKKNKIHYLKMFDKLSIEDLEDGVHPNTQGHEKIFKIVRDYLVEKKLIL